MTRGRLLALCALGGALAGCGALVESEVPPAGSRGSDPSASSSPDRGGGVVVVSVDGLRSDQGTVYVALFDRAEAFPGDAAHAVRTARVRPHAGGAEVAFEGLPRARYAVSVLHDENDSTDLDRGAFGIPLEGLGASNDAQGLFGPPTFADASFPLERGRRRVGVRVVYW